MQPTLMHQPSANLTILTNEDSQKNTSIYRKESLALDDLLSEREDPAMELLGRLSELFKKQEVQIQTLNDEVQRLQGRIRRISLENADLKSNPTTPQAYKPEELPENFLQLKIMRGPSRGPPEHKDEVPDEHTEQSREMPPSSNDAGQLCALPENFWEDDEEEEEEVLKPRRRVEVLPRWQERVSWENTRINPAPPSNSNFDGDRRLESDDKHTLARQGCQRFILLPSDPKRMAWDLTGMVLLVYDMIAIPISAFEPDDTVFSDFMGWLTQIFWTFDIIMSLLTGYVNKGQLVMSPYQIFINYLKTWFLLDLVVVGPDWVITFIQLSAHGDEGGSAGSVGRLVRTIRVVRTVRLLRLVKLKRVIDMLKDRITSEVVFILLNILKLIILLLLVNHFVASLWYLMGGLANAGTPNWRDAYGMQPGTQPLSYRYATALHWSLTQFTPATVDVHPQNMVERTFAILVLIFGLVLFSSFVSSITASMTQLRNMQEDKSKQFWLLRRYLLQKKVPQDLTFKVLRYTEYATSRSGEAIPEHRITILSLLTKQLQSELRFVTHFGCVKLHGFFKLVCTMNESLLHMMSTGKALVSKALASQDPLFELVDPALCMYFVDQGQVQYCQGQSALGLGGGLSTWAPSNFDSEGLLPPDPETVQPVTPTESGIAIGKGGHLCEIVLWAQWRHVGSARAIHESNIVQVIAKGFAECIRRDPAVDSVAAMYARMFVQLANDRERIPEDWQEICNDEMTALTDSLSEYSPDSETPKNLMSRIMALTKPKARSF